MCVSVHLVQYNCFWCWFLIYVFFFFFKQKTAYEMRISDWSSDVCSSDLNEEDEAVQPDVGEEGVLQPGRDKGGGDLADVAEEVVELGRRHLDAGDRKSVV